MTLQLLAQTYSYSAESSGSGAMGLVFWLIYLGIIGVLLAGMWKLFVKAGQPGWASIVPLYNTYIMLQIAGKPAWWLLLMLIPGVSLIVAIIIGMEIGKKFGKSELFGALLCGLLSIGYVIIGFDSSKYNGTPNA